MRPQFHFTPRSGWINDPHGITFHGGRYHTFFQYVPDSDEWRPNCHWGHAVGEDLFTLEERAVALAPGDGDDGIWTGSVHLPDADDPLSARAYYTSVSVPDFAIGRVRVARPLDEEWTDWEKGDTVLAGPPESIGARAFRDPFLVTGERRALVGAALEDGVAAAVAFAIDDDSDWAPVGIAASRPSSDRDGVWMGAMWECPQLVRVSPDRDVLLTSVWDDDVLHYAGYGVGEWNGETFAADSWRRLSYGPSYYAPSTFVDDAGRAAVIFWMREIQAPDRSWTGAHSIPYLIDPTAEGISLRPHPDLRKYRVFSASGWVEGSSAEIEWAPRTDGSLRLDIGTPLEVSRRPEGVVVAYGDESWTLPPSAGLISVIVDAMVVEVIAETGILGFPVDSVSHVRLRSGDGTRVWRLRRS